ncbi:J domain-containing protein [Thermosynechococcaceae cyanobacterium BACA0444]|uniref:J domain-containing protein n=1 Tax=Pseudocalidococcus azoricus BACA0444 TaxID=2918990 RepID=A0AAE4FSM1_9CYAN|nr:J domain-containing protein [Pseudocalidococcus azoricus]MDS3860215.1 J domain-containing protein [Pseudocalidococcus azoricus BACA0444]
MAATDFKDYYQILGVTKTASDAEIRQAFRRLARQYHPDLNPGDKAAEAKFKEINEAHEILSDKEKRQKYDQFGRYWQQPGVGGPGPGVNVDFNNMDFDFGRYNNFDEFINELLGRFGGYAGATGGGTGQTYTYGEGFPGPGVGSPVGADREAEIQLTFSEALKGCEKRLQVGAETITVRIPAGAKPGSKVRVKGKGQANPLSQIRGDLYLRVRVTPHSFFKFDGDNLTCELPITPDEAVLGTQVNLLTPAGSVNLNIPAGVRSGQSLRLQGKGWPGVKGGMGDLLVKIQVITPKDLTAAERDLYQQLAKLRQSHPRTGLENLSL